MLHSTKPTTVSPIFYARAAFSGTNPRLSRKDQKAFNTELSTFKTALLNRECVCLRSPATDTLYRTPTVKYCNTDSRPSHLEISIQSTRDVKRAITLLSQLDHKTFPITSLSINLISDYAIDESEKKFLSPEAFESAARNLAIFLNHNTALKTLTFNEQLEKNPFFISFLDYLHTSNITEIRLIKINNETSGHFSKKIKAGAFPQLRKIFSQDSKWEDDRVIQLYQALTGHKTINDVYLFCCFIKNIDLLAYRDALIELAQNTPPLQTVGVHNTSFDFKESYAILKDIGFKEHSGFKYGYFQRKSSTFIL